jgi:hypothetical protein
MEILALFPLLIYIAGITAVFAVAIAIWRGMKAQERMADSLERIEEIISRDGEPADRHICQRYYCPGHAPHFPDSTRRASRRVAQALQRLNVKI